MQYQFQQREGVEQLQTRKQNCFRFDLSSFVIHDSGNEIDNCPHDVFTAWDAVWIDRNHLSRPTPQQYEIWIQSGNTVFASRSAPSTNSSAPARRWKPAAIRSMRKGRLDPLKL